MNRWVGVGYFDVWFPVLAPSAKLLVRFKKRDLDDRSVRKTFFNVYERELRDSAESRQPLRS
jgi:uncharacterized protein YeaO (DUF488 family)